MNAKELRIGNIVESFGTNGNPNSWVEIVVNADHIKTCESRPDLFRGIKLTSEKLIEFGFSDITKLVDIKTRNSKHFCRSYFVGRCTEQQTLFIDTGNKGWMFGMHSPLYKYIHELQNLCFILTEKEIPFTP